MSLKEKIMNDLKVAMKSQDKERTSVLRMILSEVKYAQAAENVHHDLGEEAISKVIASYHKRLVKSREDFPEGDKRVAIDRELKIVEEFLAKKAGPQEVDKAISEILKSTNERQFGPLMKLVMAKLGSGADGKIISDKLKAALAQ